MHPFDRSRSKERGIVCAQRRQSNYKSDKTQYVLEETNKLSKKRSPNALCWDKSKEMLMSHDCGEGEQFRLKSESDYTLSTVYGRRKGGSSAHKEDNLRLSTTAERGFLYG